MYYYLIFKKNMEKIKNFVAGITKRDLLYFVVGIIVALILVPDGGSFGYSKFRKSGFNNNMMHKMPDGTYMKNVGMDMDDMMSGMMTGLQGKTGDDFDQAFLSEMIVHHQGAVAMAEEVLKTSKRPELLKLANDIISAQNKEIDMMGAWNKTWFNK